MKIPTKIEIQTIDQSGNSNTMENILFGFKIFVDNDDSYYTTSFFKTDKNGKLILNQSDLINNSELKWEKDINEFKIIKANIYPLEKELTSSIRKASKNYIDITTNKEVLESQLLREGFTKDNIETAKNAIEKMAVQQKINNELFKDSKNDLVQIVTTSIDDEWIDDSVKIYKFVII
ncbi:hypothetical protein [Flavobacterium daemonense]|uniref:hypothetical protein n=1 Tax=Flavobacterium daemonense TaxID=1393049 RepID=UPI001186B881|nr:hypothetical protein [Flavobacterium daemonense]KAF2333732.1 hypothetical protein FND99_09680 [Flavobacterium daemonense]